MPTLDKQALRVETLYSDDESVSTVVNRHISNCQQQDTWFQNWLIEHPDAAIRTIAEAREEGWWNA